MITLSKENVTSLFNLYNLFTESFYNKTIFELNALKEKTLKDSCVVQPVSLKNLAKLGFMYPPAEEKKVLEHFDEKEFKDETDILNHLYQCAFPANIYESIGLATLLQEGFAQTKVVIEFLDAYKEDAKNRSLKIPDTQMQFAALYASLGHISSEFHNYIADYYCIDIASGFPENLRECALDFSKLNQYSGSTQWESNFEYFVKFILKHIDQIHSNKNHISLKFLDILFDEYQNNTTVSGETYVSLALIYKTLVEARRINDLGEQPDDAILIFEEALKSHQCNNGKTIFIKPYVQLLREMTNIKKTTDDRSWLDSALLRHPKVRKLQENTRVTSDFGNGERTNRETGEILGERKIAQALSGGLPKNTDIEIKFASLCKTSVDDPEWMKNFLNIVLEQYTSKKSNASLNFKELYISVLKNQKKHSNQKSVRLWREDAIAPIAKKIDVIVKLADVIFRVNDLIKISQRIDPDFMLTEESFNDKKLKKDLKPITEAKRALDLLCQDTDDNTRAIITTLMQESGIPTFLIGLEKSDIQPHLKVPSPT